MDWKTYEEVTKGVYEAIGKDSGVRIIGHGNSCKVKGKSGVEHQIDVLAEHGDGLHRYLTSIECKYWDQTINKDILMKVREIQLDCNFQKCVVVSKLGFTPDALTYGEYYNIGLIILREPIDEDWKGRVKIIHVNMNMMSPQIVSFTHDVTKVHIDNSGKMIRVDEYYYKNESELIEMSQIVDEFQKSLSMEKGDQDQEYSKKFESGTQLISRESGIIADVSGVRIIGKLTSTIIEMEINGGDHVWMIMKAIFENKAFSIDKSGNVNEIGMPEKDT